MNIGDKVPDFLGLDQDGNEVRLSDAPDKTLVLYFYPKDKTSGCTAEACSFRDGYSELMKRGYRIVGVSKDSAKSHRSFQEMHVLPFPLIADTDTTLIQAFGLWQEKSMYGRKYMGTERATFLISPAGIITHIFKGREIKTAEHADQILNL